MALKKTKNTNAVTQKELREKSEIKTPENELQKVRESHKTIIGRLQVGNDVGKTRQVGCWPITIIAYCRCSELASDPLSLAF